MQEHEAVRFYQTMERHQIYSEGRVIASAPFVVREGDDQWPAAQASAKEQELK
jgi:hypothetical protein